MRKFSIVAATALVAAAGLVLSGCAAGGSGGSDKAEIRVWLNGTDTPKEAREYLTKTFEKQHPGSTLKIEEQSWTGLVDKLTTALSGSDSPDVVEVGNTQSPAFTTVGAFMDLSSKKKELGGDDLLPGFVEAGSADGKLYAAPYYSGARLVFYRKDMFAAAGLEAPKTLDEYVADGEKLASANAGVSGIYAPGKDWYNALPYIWENGGEIATEKGGKWSSSFSSPESIAGIEQLQQVYEKASTAPKDGDETNPQVPFCANQVAQLSAPSWVKGSILAPADSDTPGCPDLESNLGVFALPGKDGGAAHVFAGGSNIAVSNKSAHKDLAYDALKIMLSDDYQTILGKNGLVPAKKSLASTLGTDDVAKAIAEAAANSKLTPASPKWADVESSNLLQDFFSAVAQGGDVESLAADLDKKIDAILNK
ncbi:sugar ABC transporter substrate-binding protein [Schumannella luteola]|uniref:N,N'-diacetylchitobiose transport system substrate-binding protein n=1 Tax=Schumannella luteola TaxID=472059 RepID=A0A852YGU3_9MICO|nr:extracellular solute-binding protein [Schumannella luteola]NYH00545.1 N,N'-diacetylchitobiose transport system substrate-binding protein [Schumannella luteola]TPX03125.1 extracellular solute-binding protein [Schumannella luteola]